MPGCAGSSVSGSGRRDFVTASTDSHVRFDPYDVGLIADPYPMFARLREEAPLYYNAEYDFFALSRFADVNKALVDHNTYSSARGAILELIKANLEIPSGMLIFEDPPIHDVHRKLLSRMFTPRRIAALEPMIRDFCAQCAGSAGGFGPVRLRHRSGCADADEGHQHRCSASPKTTRSTSATGSTPSCAPRPASPWTPPSTACPSASSSRPTSTGAPNIRPTTS